MVRDKSIWENIGVGLFLIVVFPILFLLSYKKGQTVVINDYRKIIESYEAKGFHADLIKMNIILKDEYESISRTGYGVASQHFYKIYLEIPEGYTYKSDPEEKTTSLLVSEDTYNQLNPPEIGSIAVLVNDNKEFVFLPDEDTYLENYQSGFYERK